MAVVTSCRRYPVQGTTEGGRRRGRPRLSWTEDVRRWTRMDNDVPDLLTVVGAQTEVEETVFNSVSPPPPPSPPYQAGQ